MRKSLVIAMAILLGAGTALGATLTVPFYLDNIDGEGIDAGEAGSRTFIGIRNTLENDDIVITLDYIQFDGTDVTPEGNTFVLPANLTRAWQPVQNDPAIEGQEASEIPDATSADENASGSVVLRWTGSPSDIVGRAVQIDQDGNSFAIGLNTDATE